MPLSYFVYVFVCQTIMTCVLFVCKVEYFNNYLRDPRRPQLPPHPSSKPSTGTQQLAPAREPGYVPPTGFHGPLPPPPPVSYRPAPYPGEPFDLLSALMLHDVICDNADSSFYIVV